MSSHFFIIIMEIVHKVQPQASIFTVWSLIGSSLYTVYYVANFRSQ